jgi:hypothetical protein
MTEQAKGMSREMAIGIVKNLQSTLESQVEKDAIDVLSAPQLRKIEITRNIVEECSELVHKAYCNERLRQGKEEYWTKGDYSKLDEATKDYDRATVRAVLDIIVTRFGVPQRKVDREKIYPLIGELCDSASHDVIKEYRQGVCSACDKVVDALEATLKGETNE